MVDSTGARTHWTVWLLRLALFYSGVALVLGTQDYLLRFRPGQLDLWFTCVFQRFTQWIVWTGWTPVVVWLGDRYRLDLEPRTRHCVIHALAIVVTVPLIYCSDVFLLEVLTLRGSGRTLADKFLENFRLPPTLILGWLLMATLTWLMVLVVSYAWRYRREGQERQLEAGRLQAELAQAELHSLKSQLHPHFLFNSLNAVATLATTDPPAARRVVLLLSGLLRRALADADAQEVMLAQEIEFARSYLEIEQVRFSNRLLVEISVDPRVERARVPHLALQPLVENAVRHGIGPKAEPGTVRIEAGLANGGLRLAVIDDGVGPSRGSRGDGAGVGLANVRARLARLYGDKARLDCGERAGGGFVATVTLPLRRDDDDPGAGARGAAA